MDINKAMSICIKKDIKVYPIYNPPYFYVQVSGYDDEPKTFDKKILKNTELLDAITKTYIFYANKVV